MSTERRTTRAADLPTGTVTFLFTDIEGSTRLSQELGDGFAGVIDRHHAILRGAFSQAGGIVVSTEGDAFFAVFVDPVAAISGAVTAQRRLAAEAWPERVQLRVRMGLHTGFGRLGGDNYAGMDVNRAARVSNAGHGGQVLLSATTASLAESRLPPGVRLRPLGEVLLKDITEPEPIVQLEIDGLPAEFPPLRADRPGWLPDAATSFLGRGPELTTIDALLRESRLVTLTGPGGTGKTRLSIEVARVAQPRFPGGAWFVPLETIRDPALVLPEVADRLSLKLDAKQPVREALAERVGEKQTLFVLDNLEQVVAVSTELSQLLSEAPGLRILASSREALRVSIEQEFPVPVMDEELALLLFVDRARKVKPSFSLDPESSPDVRAIVSRLDCLPLAIELAAARLRLFPPRKLRERLDAHLESLASGSRDVTDRQRTLRGAVEWSYDLLEATERIVFGRLAVFAGGADFDAAAEVLDADGSLDGDVLDILASLSDKSLLRIEEGFGGEPRAAMLETIRGYAAERLAEDPGAAAVAERHARFYEAFAREMEPELTGEHPADAFARMELEHDNLRAAVAWAAQHEAALGLRIGGAIWRFWQQRSHLEEGRRRLEELLDRPDAASDPCALGDGTTGLGGLVYWQGDTEEARDAYTSALRAYRECGDLAKISLAAYNLSFPAAILGQPEEAARLLEESLAGYVELDDQEGVALVQEAQTVAAIIAHDYERARSIQEGVVAIRRQRGGLFKRSDSTGLLAIAEALLGDAEAARAHFDEVYEIMPELRDESGQIGALEIEALVLLAEGRPEDAAFLCGAQQGMRDRGAKYLVPSDLLHFTDPAVTAHEQLGDRFDEHFEAGRPVPPLEALERVLASS